MTRLGCTSELRAWSSIVLALVLTFAVAGCGDDDVVVPTDAARADAGTGGGDAGRRDAGVGGDASMPETDAGVGGDAGITAADAGVGSDAGALGDSGARDAGVGSDAGPPGDGGMCVDDTSEENDTIAVAMAMSPIYSLTGTTTLDSLVACSGDDDYYYGYTDCCDRAFGAELSWAPADGALELSIVDATGAPIAVDVDETTAGNRRMLQTAPSMSTYFFARVHNTGSTPVPYTLVVHAFVFGP